LTNLLDINALSGGGIDGRSLPHCFTHADGAGDKVAAGLDKFFLLDRDLLDLAVDCVGDCVEKGLVSDGSVGVGGTNFIFDSDKGFVAKLDLVEKRLPIHFEGMDFGSIVEAVDKTGTTKADTTKESRKNGGGV
jgi:hypothetical protein